MGTLLLNESKEVKTIQHRATRLIVSLHDSDYDTRLTELQ